MLRGVASGGGGGSGATLGANTFTGTQTINPAVNTSGLVVSGFSLTGTDTHSLLDLAGTWNVGATVETAIKINVTDTASGAASLFEDFQIAGVSKLNINKAGGVLSVGGFHVTNIADIGYNASGIVAASNRAIGWSSASDPTSTIDTSLFRDGAANILAQRNGANAQTLRVYNTFTDASNYERGVFDWTTTANTLTIGTQAAGTGSTRNLQFVIGGANKADYGISNSGAWTFTNNLNVGGNTIVTGNINLGAGTAFFWFGRSLLTSPANGNLLLQNNAQTDFALLQFGGTTSSFPALKRSTTTLQARLADDSAFTNIQGKLTTDNAAVTGLTPGALAALTTATLTITDSTGTVYRVPAITP